jgi:hypothetical protein
MASDNFKEFLRLNSISYELLEYSEEAVNDALSPLNTWTFRNTEAPGNFTSMPILIYKEILWESPEDENEYYAKVFYAKDINSLPTDFVSKAIKI